MLGELFTPRTASRPRNAVTVETGGLVTGVSMGAPSAESAQKLSAVFRAVELRSGSMSVLPAFVMDKDRNRVEHPILDLLNVRPNEAMTPAVRRKLLERSILLEGNAYDWIIRNPRTRRPKELIPLPAGLVQPWLDSNMRPWYDVYHPVTGAVMRLPGDDVCHYKGPSRNGFTGVSVLTYARETIQGGLAAGAYNTRFYESGGQPSGVLTVDADLSGYAKDQNGEPTTRTRKDVLRDEWERVHSGPSNAHRIAVLDLGLKYQPLSISQTDSQFVEQQEITVLDIARFFGIPAYKLQAGKQSYNANEQQSIEYVTELLPRVNQKEEEKTWKLLMDSDVSKGLRIRSDMDALLRGDSVHRATFYKAMRECGAFSVNDIMRREDMPDVAGGDERQASLNYVPLSVWPDLSIRRNGGETK